MRTTFYRLFIAATCATAPLRCYATETSSSQAFVTDLKLLQTSGLIGSVYFATTDGFGFGGDSETRTGFSVFPPTTWRTDSTQRAPGTLSGLTTFRQVANASTFASISPDQLSTKAVSDPTGVSSYSVSITSAACSSCTNLFLGPNSAAVVSFQLSALSQVSPFATSAYTWSTTYLEITGGGDPRQTLYAETCAATDELFYLCGDTTPEIVGFHSFTLTNSSNSRKLYKFGFSTSAYAGALATQVPELSTIAMLGIGLSALVLMRQRQIRKTEGFSGKAIAA